MWMRLYECKGDLLLKEGEGCKEGKRRRKREK